MNCPTATDWVEINQNRNGAQVHAQPSQPNLTKYFETQFSM